MSNILYFLSRGYGVHRGRPKDARIKRERKGGEREREREMQNQKFSWGWRSSCTRAARIAVVAAIVLLAVGRKVEGVVGAGCTSEDLRRVKRDLNACLPQFFRPEAFALPRSLSCCANESARCCHSLRAALPIGDDCICTFLLHAMRRNRGLPYSIDVPAAAMQLSSQCHVDFGFYSFSSPSSGRRKCGAFNVP
ncbi:hypothetical protein KP509_24G039800 [Ceratopteris richardii]|uniref:Bifunctional inhibitor/plant lipid transfer protein/seed storage helical domain-containing protein n=1 Tax=Ceratopteris richardii TaxID=49495 RepID=A0A8T2RWL4_CERRI|nr:hypothetical protein KP509_24G039800 [Ceratopteris richardii]KAH7299989.1 hypothetical protein KP509_24G039800 [Ceratopteris richardii]